MPFFSAKAKASDIASTADRIMKLPQSLTTFAAPGSSPKSCTDCPIASSSGRAASLACAEPDRQIQSFAAAAASGRPKTGAAR